MKFAAFIVAVTTATFIRVHGAALPRGRTLDVANQPDTKTSPAQEALQGLSQLFSYQLAGIVDGPNEQLLTCRNLKGMFPGRWDAIGLDTSVIQGSVCNPSHNDINSTYAITNSIMAHTNLLTTQLLNSFNSTDQFDTLCDDLRLDLIEEFPIIGSLVKQAVCKRSSYQQMAPQPFGSPPPVNTEAVTAAKNTESTLFAVLLVAGMETSSEVNAACYHSPYYTVSLNNENLNGSAVVSTLCENTAPFSVGEAQALIATWQTRYYITVLESISNVSGWLSWLCKNVDVDMMNAVGLNGIDVQQRVCSDGKYFNKMDSTAQPASI